MKVAHDLDALRDETRPLFLAIGFFDGVHVGHQRILEVAVEMARSASGEAWALTFEPHPAKVLSPAKAPLLLTSYEHKLRLIEKTGVTGCVVLRFTSEFAQLSPHDYLDTLQTVPRLRGIVVGANWRFGHNRAGDAGLLRREADRRGWTAVVVEPLLYAGRPISSTRIRNDVAAGRLDEAMRMLGRRFSIWGTVVPGKKVGRQLGYPTINLDPHNEVRPPSGIYAVWAHVEHERFGGAAFLADIPHAMEGPSGFLLEVHLLDFNREVYGQNVEVEFVQWIRESQQFASLAALKEQIGRDIEAVRGILMRDDADR